MVSQALVDWRTIGLARLGELEGVHAQVTGSGRGRRWGTEQLNRSLFVALVAQFQGYCRELHDEAIAVHVAHATEGQRSLVQTLLAQGRKLDTQNPRRSTLGSDFGRLGFQFIDDLKAEGLSTERHLDHLETLVDFRNAIGHGDESRIATIEFAETIRSTKRSYLLHRRSLNRLVGTMDSVVARELASVLGIRPPW